MRRLSVWMQMSLDGFSAGPAGELDWPVVAGDLHRYFVDELGRRGAFLYGRKVYEMMAAYWPTADTDPSSTVAQVAYSRLWKPMPKYVFSGSLEHAGWNTTIVRGDIAAAVNELKEQPGGDLVLLGGPTTAATFQRLGLVDDFHVFVHPVVLGGGAPLFAPADDRTHLELVGARAFDGAVVHLHHEVVRK